MTLLSRTREKNSNRSKEKDGKAERSSKKSAKILIHVSFKPPRATQSPILFSSHLEAQEASRWSTNEESKPCQHSMRSHHHWEVMRESVTVKPQSLSQPGTDPRSKIALGKTVTGMWHCSLPLKQPLQVVRRWRRQGQGLDAAAAL